jgi:hypothetical protein
LVRTSLSPRLISLWLNRHQVQGFGSCPLRAAISRPWRFFIAPENYRYHAVSKV